MPIALTTTNLAPAATLLSRYCSTEDALSLAIVNLPAQDLLVHAYDASVAAAGRAGRRMTVTFHTASNKAYLAMSAAGSQAGSAIAGASTHAGLAVGRVGQQATQAASNVAVKASAAAYKGAATATHKALAKAFSEGTAQQLLALLPGAAHAPSTPLRPFPSLPQSAASLACQHAALARLQPALRATLEVHQQQQQTAKALVPGLWSRVTHPVARVLLPVAIGVIVALGVLYIPFTALFFGLVAGLITHYFMRDTDPALPNIAAPVNPQTPAAAPAPPPAPDVRQAAPAPATPARPAAAAPSRPSLIFPHPSLQANAGLRPRLEEARQSRICTIYGQEARHLDFLLAQPVGVNQLFAPLHERYTQAVQRAEVLCHERQAKLTKLKVSAAMGRVGNLSAAFTGIASAGLFMGLPIWGIVRVPLTLAAIAATAANYFTLNYGTGSAAGGQRTAIDATTQQHSDSLALFESEAQAYRALDTALTDAALRVAAMLVAPHA